MAADTLPHRLRGTFEAVLPLVEWLPKYNRSWLRRDVSAGMTVAAAVIPEALAYASLAEMPAQAGLYASLAAVFVFVLFTTSRQVIAGPTSPLALLLVTSVGSVAAASSADYVSLIAVTTVMVGLVGLVAWAFRLGVLANLISGSVITGFASGAGLYIMSTQIGKLLGISGGSGTFFDRIWFTVTHLNQVQSTTAMVGISSVVLLFLGKRYLSRIPAALLVVLLSIAVSVAFNLQSRGVDIVGNIRGGLPSLTVPQVPEISVIQQLVPVALALFALSYIQGIGAIDTFARRHDYEVDPNQELLADGTANLAAGLVGGFAVGGSMSRSALNDEVGGKTQVVSFVAGLVLLAVLVFLTGLFTTLPEATLAAVIIVAVFGIVDAAGMQRLFQISRGEFVIASAALLGVLTFGMLWGVFIGVGLSIVFTIARASNPKTEELAQSPGTDHYVSKSRYTDSISDPGVLVYRVDAMLFFANTALVREDLLKRVREHEQSVDLVVFDLFSSPMVDLAAANMLDDLYDKLSARGTDLRLAGANVNVHRLLRAAGLEQKFGKIREDEAIDTVVQRWKTTHADRKPKAQKDVNGGDDS